jgi:MoxR-like ATPase
VENISISILKVMPKKIKALPPRKINKPKLPSTAKGWRRRALKLALNLAPIKTIKNIILAGIVKTILIISKKQKLQQTQKPIKYVLRFGGSFEIKIPQIKGIDLFVIINNLKRKYYEFNPLLNVVEFIEEPSIPTAMTDGWKIYYNSKFLASQDETFAEAVLLHELLHIIRKDIQTMKKLELNPQLWNLATDKVINEEIINEYGGNKIPLLVEIHKGNINYIEQVIQKDIASMDEFEIYSELKQNQNKNNGNGNDSNDNNNNDGNNQNNNNDNNNNIENNNSNDNTPNNNNQNDSNNNSNNDNDNNQDNNNQSKPTSFDELKEISDEELTETEKEYRRKLVEAIEEYKRLKPQEQAKRRGSGNITEKLILNKVQEKVKVNLKKIAKEIEKKSLYENPIKRQTTGIISFPTKTEKPDVIIILDVSGSMTLPIKEKIAALDIAQLVIKEIDKNFNIIKIITGNEALVEVRKTANISKIQAGGGTNMKKVLHQIEEQKKIKHQNIILITDADDDLENIQTQNKVYGVFITSKEPQTNIPYTRVYLEFLDLRELGEYMPIINLKTLKELIKIYIRQNRTLIVWGYYGIGKTQIMRQIAEEMNLELIEINVPVINEEDIKGVRVYSEKKDQILAKVFGPLSRINPDKKTLVYLDEINRTKNKEILNALLKIILDKDLPFIELTPQQKENIVFILTANPEDESVYELDAALLNRMGQVFLMPNPSIAEDEEWVNYISTKHNIKTEILKKLLKGIVIEFDNKFKMNITPRSLESAIEIIAQNNFKLNEIEKLYIQTILHKKAANIILNNLTKILDNLEDLNEKMKQKFYNETFNFNQLSLQEKRIMVEVIQQQLINTDKYIEVMTRLYDIIKDIPENKILLNQTLIPIFDKVKELQKIAVVEKKTTFKSQEIYRQAKEMLETLQFYIAIDEVINTNKVKWYIDNAEKEEIIKYLINNGNIDEESEFNANYFINDILNAVYDITKIMSDGEIFITFLNEYIPTNIEIIEVKSYTIIFKYRIWDYTIKIELYNPNGIKTIREILQKFTTTDYFFNQFRDEIEQQFNNNFNKIIEEFLQENEFVNTQITTDEIEKVVIKYNPYHNTSIIEVHINNIIYTKTFEGYIRELFKYNLILENNTLYSIESFNTLYELKIILEEVNTEVLEDIETIATIIKIFGNRRFKASLYRNISQEKDIKIYVKEKEINIITYNETITLETNEIIKDPKILVFAGEYKVIEEIEVKLNKILNDEDVKLDISYIDKECLEFIVIDTKIIETLTDIYWEVSDKEYKTIKNKIKKNYNETDKYLKVLAENLMYILVQIGSLMYNGKILVKSITTKQLKTNVKIIKIQEKEIEFIINVLGYNFRINISNPFSIEDIVQILKQFTKTKYEEKDFIYKLYDKINNEIENTIPKILQEMGFIKTQEETTFGKIICKYNYKTQTTKIEVHWGKIYIKEKKGIYQFTTEHRIVMGTLNSQTHFYNKTELKEELEKLESRIQDKVEIDLVNEIIKIVEFLRAEVKAYFRKDYYDINPKLIIRYGEFNHIIIQKDEFFIMLEPVNKRLLLNSKALVLAGKYNNFNEVEERINKVKNNKDVILNTEYISQVYLSFLVMKEEINQAEIKWYLGDLEKEELEKYLKTEINEFEDIEMYLDEFIDDIREFLELVTLIAEGADINLTFINEQKQQNIEIIECNKNRIIFEIKIRDYSFRIEILSDEAKTLEKILKPFTTTNLTYTEFLTKINEEIEKERNNKITKMFEDFNISQNDKYETKIEVIYNIDTYQTTIKVYVLNIIYTKTIRGMSLIFSRKGWFSYNKIYYEYQYETIQELNDILYVEIMSIETNIEILNILNLFEKISKKAIITSFDYDISPSINNQGNEIEVYIDLIKNDVIGDEINIYIKHPNYDIRIEFEKSLLHTEALLLAGKYNNINELFYKTYKISKPTENLIINTDYINQELLI